MQTAQHISRRSLSGNFHQFPRLLLLLFLLLAGGLQAGTITDQREAMSILSSLTSWDTILAGLQANTGIDRGAVFDWDMSTTATSATMTSISGSLHGMPLALTYSGTLTGAIGSDLNWSGTWSGTLGGTAVTASDTLTWGYDSLPGGYSNIIHDQDGQLAGGGGEWFVRAAGTLFAIVGGSVEANWASASPELGEVGILGEAAIHITVPLPRPPPPIPPPAPPVEIPPPETPGEWITGLTETVAGVTLSGYHVTQERVKIKIIDGRQVGPPVPDPEMPRLIGGRTSITPEPSSLAILLGAAWILASHRRQASSARMISA